VHAAQALRLASNSIMPTCIFLTAILLTLSLFSVERTQEQTTVPPDTLITLDRFPNAFNSGTRYTLTISSDGKVIFQRFRNTFVERFDPKDIALETYSCNYS
jgi:hypothetical protein